ncbi:MAG: C40 family peptidase [Porphyromonas sp.]|nr:C40 family peptidase [Porphyromonas sp.]
MRQPAQRIYLPSEEALTVKKLTEQISATLRIPLDEKEDNIGLYAFVADWIGVPYRMGAYGKKGTDCSGFTYQLYRSVYDYDLGRTSAASMMSQTYRVRREDLQEGDLVFFNINNRRGGQASHVGVYLKNNLFAHASTSRGVIISSLLEPYYSSTFLSGGRVK